MHSGKHEKKESKEDKIKSQYQEDIEDFFSFISVLSHGEDFAGPVKAIKKNYLGYLRNLLNTNEELTFPWTTLDNDRLLARINILIQMKTFEDNNFNPDILDRIVQDLKNKKDEKIQLDAEEKDNLLQLIETLESEMDYGLDDAHENAKNKLAAEARISYFSALQEMIDTSNTAGKYEDSLRILGTAMEDIVAYEPLLSEEKEFLKTNCISLYHTFSTMPHAHNFEDKAYEIMLMHYNAIEALKLLPKKLLNDDDKINLVHSQISFAIFAANAAEILTREDKLDQEAEVIALAIDELDAIELEDLEKIPKQTWLSKGINDIDKYLVRLYSSLEKEKENITAPEAKSEARPLKRIKTSATLFSEPAAAERSVAKDEEKSEKTPHTKKRRGQP